MRGTNVQTEREPRLRDTFEYSEFKCIVFPDDELYGKWEYVMILLMVYTAVVTPFAIALLDINSSEWILTDSIVDALFGLDLIIN